MTLLDLIITVLDHPARWTGAVLTAAAALLTYGLWPTKGTDQ